MRTLTGTPIEMTMQRVQTFIMTTLAVAALLIFGAVMLPVAFACGMAIGIQILG